MMYFSTNDQSSVVLQKIYKTKMYSDITLVAGKDGKRIRTHKVVLVAALDYFERMFSGSFKEETATEVTIDNVDMGVLEIVIKYLYLGLVEISDVNTAIELFKVSHLMEITVLQDYAVDYMKRHLAPDNCLSLISVGKTYELNKLAFDSELCAVKKFEDVIRGDQFKNLCKEEMIFYAPLWNNSINVDDLAKAILDWIISDESRRNLCLKELLQLVNIHLIEEEDLILKLCSTCIDFDETKYKYIVGSLFKQQIENTCNMFNSNPDMILLVKHMLNHKKSLYFYNASRDEFVGRSQITEKGDVIGIWERKIVVLYSKEDNRMVKTYDLEKDLTTTIGTYCFEDHKFSKIFNGYLYIFSRRSFLTINLATGASNQIIPNYSFESCVYFKNQLHFMAYRPSDKSTRWLTTFKKTYASFQNPTAKMGQIVVHNQKIYYFGHKVLVYNAEEDTWTKEMRYKFSKHPQLITTHNKLLVSYKQSIFEFTAGSLKPFDSKLNMLDLESELRIFSCN